MADQKENAINDNQEIELIGDDLVSVKVKASLLRKFPWFAAMIDFNKNTFINFESVNGALLATIKKWIEYEGSGQMPTLIDPDTKSFRKLTEWEENFLRGISDDELVVLMKAADFFEMKNFQEILTYRTANRCTELQIPQIRAMFEIVDSGYTPKQEQKLESEARWVSKFHD